MLGPVVVRKARYPLCYTKMLFSNGTALPGLKMTRKLRILVVLDMF